MIISKYSFGIGDRFGQQGKALLKAFLEARKLGVEITPVWNKSYREHKTVMTRPQSVRIEADESVKALNWNSEYLVDADHISLETVDDFLKESDFFTIDVADFIGEEPQKDAKKKFISKLSDLKGIVKINGISDSFEITSDSLDEFADKFMVSIKKAAEIYSYIERNRNEGFIIEVSMDEVEDPQHPLDLLLILAGLNNENVPVQTIAPKFTGRFNKGVDYDGDVDAFRKEFEDDVLVIDYAIRNLGLPESLKLSIHSGSDKFSIYEPIKQVLTKHDKGVHIKTAGTTWLEELAGLAISGKEGLKISKNIYHSALSRFDELTIPYATVIDVNKTTLPSSLEVYSWSGTQFFNALSHNQEIPEYNPEFRQMLHVAYKIAAEMGDNFINMLKKKEAIIAPLVTENIFARHIKPLFID